MKEYQIIQEEFIFTIAKTQFKSKHLKRIFFYLGRYKTQIFLHTLYAPLDVPYPPAGIIHLLGWNKQFAFI